MMYPTTIHELNEPLYQVQQFPMASQCFTGQLTTF